VNRNEKTLIPRAANHDGTEGVYNGTEAMMLPLFKAFVDNPDYIRCVAWTNARVLELNKLIRRSIYGDECDAIPFTEGEWVYSRGPLYSFNDFHSGLVAVSFKHKSIRCASPVYTTADEFRVLSYERIAYTPNIMVDANTGRKPNYSSACKVVAFDEYTAPAYILNTESVNGEKHRILVGAPGYNEIQKYANLARNSKGSAAWLPWQCFWQLKALSSVRHSYAMTAHMAQGSTYENVFIDEANILRNRSNKESMQCAYVALTRASKKAYVL